MNDDAYEQHFPKDLEDIGDALREHREVADGHQLERIRRRFQGEPTPSVRSWQRWVPRRARTRAALILVVGFALNVSGAMATVLTDCGVSGSSASSLNLGQIITTILTNTSNGNGYQSAGDHVYCPTQGTSYTSYGVMNGGSGGDKNCCPQQSGGYTSYGQMQGGSGGSNNNQCCPSSSGGSGGYTSYGQMQGGSGGYGGSGGSGGSQNCCPSSNGYVTINGQMQGGSGGGGGGSQCCPSSSTGMSYGTNNQQTCCPSGSKPGYTTNTQMSGNPTTCCPNTSTSSTCCPNTSSTGTTYGTNNNTGSGGMCCPTTSTGTSWGTNNQQTCCPSGTKPGYTTNNQMSGNPTTCCPNTSNSSTCCPNSSTTGTTYGTNNNTGSSGMCCPSGSSGGYATNGVMNGTPTTCCPSSTGSKTTGGTCCPNTNTGGKTGQVCCPQQQTSYGVVSNGIKTSSSSCCPNGTKVGVRWHYSSGGSSGSWSGTQSQGEGGNWSINGSMEGNLKVSPGATLKAGYDVDVPGNSQSVWFTVSNPTITFNVACVSGARPSSNSISLSLPSQEYAMSDGNWYPSDSQSNSLVYQGSTTVPNLCKGGQMTLSQGGSFGASFS